MDRKSPDAPTDMRQGPLTGIRVLDLTSVVLGPAATQILGDYGADIVKIESPSGDMMRANGVSRHAGMSSIFLTLNRNKRSLSLDLTKPEGVLLLRRMLPRFDVLVHNMRVSAIERLGFGYADVALIHPSIVYCAATGFEQAGPDRDKPAFDDIIQAASGMAALQSRGQGEPDYVPTLIADKTAGLSVVNAVLAALLHRGRTGQGQYVEVPMLETFTAFVMSEHLNGLSFDPPIAPAGYARLLDGGRKPWPTADGYIAMLPYTGAHWNAFFKETGRQDLADSLAVSDKQKRNENIKKLYGAVSETLRTRTSAEWIEVCTRLDIPATPIYALEDVPSHPQLQAVNLFPTMEHPSEGTLRYVRPTLKFAASPAGTPSPAPLLGQHSRTILTEAGIGAGEIARLIETGVVVETALPSKADA
jgi:formyl-CoA transferase